MLKAGLVNRVGRAVKNFEFHVSHDQKSHGNWATGGSVSSDEGGSRADFRDTFEGAFDPHGLMDKNPKIGRAGSMALDTIASVHGIEADWPKAISMVDNGEWLGEDEGSLGAYMPPERSSDPEQDIPRGRVVLRGTKDEGAMATTLVHELGHHLTLARGVDEFHKEMADEESPLSSLMDVLAATQTNKDMNKIREQMVKAFKAAAPHEGDRRAQILEQKGFVDYLQMPEEMFARAYAQYIAVKSGNKTMLKDIDRTIRDENTGGIMQWPAKEFEPVMTAMERYLRERGLMN
jgi:hypothetical protein